MSNVYIKTKIRSGKTAMDYLGIYKIKRFILSAISSWLKTEA